MNIIIKKVETAREMHAFIDLPYRLYAHNPYYVPPLRFEQRQFFQHNPASKVAQSAFFLALDGELVIGRVGGIIHQLENEKLGYKRGRFGFFECVEQEHVALALMATVSYWLVAEGCCEMTGPHAYTDLDMEGLLIEGFEEVPPITCGYHMPYYQGFLEKFGLQKQVDYIEHRILLPASFPTYEKLKDKLLNHPDYHLLPLKRIKELLPYLPQFWPLMEECYAHLHGVTPLTKEQQESYTKNNLAILDPDFVKIVLDRHDHVVGFFVGMPNLSRAFQFAKGRLTPWSLWRIWRDYRRAEGIDFVLIGVKPGLPKTTIMMLLMGAMYETCVKRGVKYFESNRQLETNFTIADVWKRFESRLHRRARMYRMDLK